MNDPIPTPPSLPAPPPGYGYHPVWRDQRAVDAGHLRLLWIFHYVFAGLGVLGLAFLGMHYLFMSTMFANPKMWQHAGRQAPPFDPAVFFQAFKWFYLFIAALIVLGMVLNVISGWYIARRQSRIFSMVVAGLNCFQFPFGTALGVFTLIVLGRETVRQAYDEPTSTPVPPAPAG